MEWVSDNEPTSGTKWDQAMTQTWGRTQGLGCHDQDMVFGTEYHDPRSIQRRTGTYALACIHQEGPTKRRLHEAPSPVHTADSA